MSGDDKTITILEWKPVYKGTLRGFATIRIDRMRLRINDVGIFEKEENRWAMLPSKPMTRDGKVVCDDNGKPRYQSMMDWSDKETATRFSSAVVEALLERFPSAFEP